MSVTAEEQAQAKLDRIRKEWKETLDAGTPQRKREQADLRFQVPEYQWSDDDRASRKGRPVLTVNKTDQPIQLIMAQIRNAQLGVDISPISEDSDQETAEAIQGLYRDVERRSRADIARGWAAKRAVAAGTGWWRVVTEYDPHGGHPTDQRIAIKRILHQENVYPDPAAQEPDYSDGMRLFYVVRMRLADFKKRYPKAERDPASDSEWDDITAMPDWMQGEDVTVAEYWYRERHFDPVSIDDKVVGERETFTVHRCVTNGLEILEEGDWHGQFIPFIPALGNELLPFDGERWWMGVIGLAKDGQKLFNAAASTVVERMMLEPKTPFIGYAEQFKGYKEFWDKANTENMPYLPVNMLSDDGKVMPLPQRAQIDQTGTSLAMMVVQAAESFIQSTTAFHDPSLGRESSRDKSGKAILALQQQADAGTSQYLQNLADISMTYEAMVILDLIPHIYDRPGRVVRILRGDDDKSESVMLNQPFVMDPQTGRPMPAQGQPNAKEFDLRKGVYSVSVSIGKSFQTRMEQGAQFIGEMLQAMPEYLPLIGDLFFRYRDDPGAKQIADRLAKLREQKFPGLGEGEDGTLDPKAAAAKLQAVEMHVKELEGALQQAMQKIEMDAAKEGVRQQGALEKAKLDNETRLAVASMGRDEAAQKDATTVALQRMEQAFEAQQNELDRRLELFLAKLDRAHEVAMAAAGGTTMTHTREGGQETGEEHEDETSQGQSRQPAQEEGEA